MNKEIFNGHFCDDMEGFGSAFLDSYISTLFHGPAVATVKNRYSEMIYYFNNPNAEWKEMDGCEYNISGDLFISVDLINDSTLKGKKNIGIDLPVWFNNASKKARIMLVAMEPRRDEKASKDGYATLSTPFALAYLKRPKHAPSFSFFYNFVAELLENGHPVYVTDIGKSYSLTEANRKHTGNANLNKSLFEIELENFNPDLIFAFGNRVKAKVDEIVKDYNYSLAVASKYFPHPASRVERNYSERYNQSLEEYRTISESAMLW